MMNFKHVIAALLIAGTLSVTASAQSTASQRFVVRVPANIAISAPSEVEITHDESDANQAFPTQSWEVRGNVRAGVTATFNMISPFVHTVDNTFVRDAALAVSVGNTRGPGAWSTTLATGQTNIGATPAVNSALVQVQSDGVGSADIDLDVTFITDTFGDFAEGEYATTVVGTVSAN